jgi:hypothetical protein
MSRAATGEEILAGRADLRSIAMDRLGEFSSIYYKESLESIFSLDIGRCPPKHREGI